MWVFIPTGCKGSDYINVVQDVISSDCVRIMQK